MGKINWCLKRLFISFNMKFAILGVVLIYVPIQSSPYSHQLTAVSSPNLVWSWVFAISILGISCLGIYAAFSEKEIILKIFAGFMGVGMIIMLIFGIIMVVRRNKFESSFDSTTAELAKSFKEDEELRTLLEELQKDAQCCGVVSASDWGENIPSSCKCSGYGGFGGYEGSECKSKPQGVSGPDQIYAKPCSEIMFRSKDSDFVTAMSLCFGFSIFPLLCLLLSLLMIHQVRRHDGRIFHFYEVILRTPQPLTPDL